MGPPSVLVGDLGGSSGGGRLRAKSSAMRQERID